MKHSASLSTILAMVASMAAAMRGEQFASELTADNPARARFGKRGGGSKKFKRAGHPLFRRLRIRNAQPFGDDYNLQQIDPRHWHPAHLRPINKFGLNRPQFA